MLWSCYRSEKERPFRPPSDEKHHSEDRSKRDRDREREKRNRDQRHTTDEISTEGWGNHPTEFRTHSYGSTQGFRGGHLSKCSRTCFKRFITISDTNPKISQKSKINLPPHLIEKVQDSSEYHKEFHIVRFSGGRNEWGQQHACPPPISAQQVQENLPPRSNYTSLKRNHSNSSASERKTESPKDPRGPAKLEEPKTEKSPLKVSRLRFSKEGKVTFYKYI